MQTKQIVTLTENAIKHIHKNLNKDSAAIGLRLSIKKTGCSGFAYVTDLIHQIKNEEDIHYKIQDIALYIDPSSAKYLQGVVVDFVDNGLGQTKLVFHNPNAANLCGCGESFTVTEELKDE